MKKPIYLYVTPFFPAPGRHYGSYGYDFVQALKRNSDYDVRVFVAGKGNDYDFEGCHVCRFPIISLPSSLFPFLFARHNAKSFVDAVKRTGIDIDDVVVCHGNTATYAIYPLAIKQLNARCLTLLHHHDLDGFGLRIGLFRHVWLHKVINFLIVRRLFEMLDCHVFISEASRRSTVAFPDTKWSYYSDYRSMGDGLWCFKPAELKCTMVLWNGVDTEKFNVNGRVLKNKDVGFTVGCVGNFVEVKDHISLLMAIKLLKSKIRRLHVDILGTNGVGRFFKNSVKYVKDNDLHDIVRFIENVPQSKMSDYYRKWDLMVLPSYFEGFGCVYLESWACGTPFIACRGQGIEDVLPESEKGKWLCNPHDKQDIANKILNYYENKDSQKLKEEISIDVLVTSFLEKIAMMRKDVLHK